MRDSLHSSRTAEHPRCSLAVMLNNTFNGHVSGLDFVVLMLNTFGPQRPERATKADDNIGLIHHTVYEQ